ncbi:hypothetical protein DKT69_23360 [Micromonospora sicca]|uniref:Fibronectin type-III domain-containing protein n=1 Tax=Micromonospora sicca TaxID=2202420 RepID=A0A317DII5_9ACTN|nr:hypothetical protein [Micromonospora sp. 4G51]PWR12613.1 hypothetical protein DKT69_23360 [Micromonospora sp. 4G51]
MIRAPLLAAAVVLTAAACASTGTPPDTGPESPSPPSPSSGPAGITSQEAARIAPVAPALLTAFPDTGTVRLTWSSTGEDLAYYQCLRRSPDGRWAPIGQTPPTRRSCVDRNPGSGSRVYGVRAVSTSGLASAITESRPVTTG